MSRQPHLIAETGGSQFALTQILDIHDSIAQIANGPDSFTETVQSILLNVASRVFTESLSVLLYNGPKDRLELRAITNVGLSDSIVEIQEPGSHLTGTAYQENKSIISNSLATNNVSDKTMIDYWASRLPSGTLDHGAFIPFRSSLECSGVFRAFNRINRDGQVEPSGFSEADCDDLQTLSRLIARLFGNAWERYQYHRLGRLFSELTGKSDVSEICANASRAACEISNGASANVYLVDFSDDSILRKVGSYGFSREYKRLKRFSADTSIAGKVAKKGESQIIKNLATAKGVANREIAESEGLKSSVVVPVTGAGLAGALAIFARDERGYQKATVDTLETLGAFIGNLLSARSQAVRTEQLRKVLGWVGHSMRSPLAMMSGLCDDIRFEVRKEEVNNSVLKLLDDVFAEIERAGNLLESLLFSKPGIIDVMGLNKEAVHLGSLVEEAARRHRRSAKSRGIRIVAYDSAKRLPVCNVDRFKIEIVLDNILENAVKYSWKNENIIIKGWFSEKVARIDVADKGLGIPEKYRDLIFQAFTRSDVLDSERFIQGTGLGLELVRAILEAHGGSVEVDSQPFLDDPRRVEKFEGYDTTFSLTIPR